VLEDELIRVLEPLVRRVVREELAGRETKRGWVSVPKAAEHLGISTTAVYNRARRGQLPSKTVGRTVYIDLDRL